MSADYPDTHLTGDDNPLSGPGWTVPAFPVLDDLPAHDGRGEIVDAEVVDDPAPAPVSADLVASLPGTIARDGMHAVEWYRSPDQVRDLTHKATGALLDQLRAHLAGVRAQRPDGPQTPATLAPELQLLADAHDSLVAVRGVFDAGAREAKALAGEVAHELADDPRRGSTSVKVADGHGADVKVTRTQPTKVRTDVPELVDVLVAFTLSQLDLAAVPREDRGLVMVNAGVAVRHALALYREVAASHEFKTTALDNLVGTLEDADEHDLAIRLGHAYGRVSHGEAQVKVERVERKRDGD